MFEERVVRDGDFVVANVRLAAGETEGLRVGDEVHLVTARGELDAEFRGDDATTAVGGIAGDADLHKLPVFLGCVRGFGCDSGCWTRLPVYKTRSRPVSGTGSSVAPCAARFP